MHGLGVVCSGDATDYFTSGVQHIFSIINLSEEKCEMHVVKEMFIIRIVTFFTLRLREGNYLEVMGSDAFHQVSPKGFPRFALEDL